MFIACLHHFYNIFLYLSFNFLFKITARRISIRVSAGIGSVFLIQPTGQKRQEKNAFFLNGVVTRSFATPLSANMMPSFRESSRGHQKFQYPPKKLKHRKILRNGDNTKYKNPYNRLPTGPF